MAYIGPKNRENNRTPSNGVMFVLFADDSPESERRMAQINRAALNLGKDPADIVQDLIEAALDAILDPPE